MADKLSGFTIQKMAQLLKVRKHTHGHTVLFLGARTGGLFRSQFFYNSLQDFSLRDFSKLNGFERFEECYHVLNRPGNFVETDIDRILTASLRGVSTIYADLRLADLIKQGIFDLVITTCIDDILEQALSRVDLREANDYSVFVPRKGVDTQNRYIDRSVIFRIWKVFGDLGSREYTTTKRFSYVQAHDDLRKVLEETRTRDVLMVGFDQVWDGDILHFLFPRSASTCLLWYVNDQEPLEEMKIYPYLQDCQARWISGLEGNYENFFQELHWQITGRSLIPPYQVEQDLLRELHIIQLEVQKVFQKSTAEFDVFRRQMLQTLESSIQAFRQEMLQKMETYQEMLRNGSLQIVVPSERQMTENKGSTGDEKTAENEKK